jgi:hypothetical protein
VSDQVSHPFKTAGKIIILYIAIYDKIHNFAERIKPPFRSVAQCDVNSAK